LHKNHITITYPFIHLLIPHVTSSILRPEKNNFCTSNHYTEAKVGWYKSVITAQGKLRQENSEFEASLGYIARGGREKGVDDGGGL
jgi:hypothetical protein